ncbi:hypothetical protein F5B20DRAFT_376629 [Whalleya microplaca]|nr:hypothetical protein F5B20DRAFT_376629 [Whalleya microplaca]
MMTTTTTATEPGAAPKHRACDECRTRKLACTKEADGCTRCKREGIPCHYSAQKPMGRPRKRPRDDESNDIDMTAPASKNTMIEIPPDTSDPGLAFINLLTTGSTNDENEPFRIDAPEMGSQDRGFSWNFGYTGDAFGDMSFDPTPAEQTPSYPPLNLDPALFGSGHPSPPDPVPSLTPNSAGTPESNNTSLSAAAATATRCTHTASLYLALNSLQNLPTAVEPAIAQARAAARTAYDVVNCPACSFRIEPPPSLLQPSHQHEQQEHAFLAAAMDGFQNLMLLATLIPSTVHAYQRILALVDAEAERATRERRPLAFKLHGLGGVWGRWASGGDGEDPCPGALDSFGHREMEPAMWRLVVRALLKVDVYGLSCDDACMEGKGPGPLHLGLKDIVLQMEARTKARHAFMDAMILSGAWRDPTGCGLGKLNSDGEPPQCQRIIAIAKQSIDRLVIA